MEYSQPHCVYNGPLSLAHRFADIVFESLLFRELSLKERTSEYSTAADGFEGKSVSAAVFRKTIHDIFVANVPKTKNLKRMADLAMAGASAKKRRLERIHFPLVIMKVASQVEMPASDVAQRIISSGEVSISIPVHVCWMSPQWYESPCVQRVIAEELHEMGKLCKRFEATSALAAALMTLSSEGGVPLFPQKALTFVIDIAEQEEGKRICLRSFAFILVHVVSFATSEELISSNDVLKRRLKSGLNALHNLLAVMEARIEQPRSSTQAELLRIDPPSFEAIMSSPQPQRLRRGQKNYTKLAQRSLEIHESFSSRHSTPRRTVASDSLVPVTPESAVSNNVHISTPYPKISPEFTARVVRSRHGLRRTMSESDSTTFSSGRVDVNRGGDERSKYTYPFIAFLVASIFIALLAIMIHPIAFGPEGLLYDLLQTVHPVGVPV